MRQRCSHALAALEQFRPDYVKANPAVALHSFARKIAPPECSEKRRAEGLIARGDK
jgi:hypothetical protein